MDEDASGLPRPGIVHRLDKGTSGLLVVAKHSAAREALKAQFSAHEVEREYVAITVGDPGAVTIDTPYGRNPRDRLRFTSRGRIAGGKRAITHVRTLESLGPATLVACRLETGRTHQIRVHLAEQRGAPILGDPVYGKRPKDADLAALALGLGRQALHARLLGLRHPRSGRLVRWESEPPADIAAVLAALRATRPAI
jgi:23S rRNA pseudouridine1911/1915/1917 synthase